MPDPATVSQPPSEAARHQRSISQITVALAFIGTSFWFDAPIERWVTMHQSPGAVATAGTISRLGSWPWLMGMAALCLVFAWARGRWESVHILVAIMIAASLAGLSADILRGITGRTRPYATPMGIASQGWYGVHDGTQWLVGRHAYNSFPSGHTSTATAFSVTLLWYRRRPGFVLLLGAALVGATRIYLGAHHFSDVVAGAILGIVVALVVQRLFMPWLWRRFEAGRIPAP